MTRDDILRMAKEAVECCPQGDTRDPLDVYLHEVFVFAELVAAAEREKCAKEIERLACRESSIRADILQEAADLIRSNC